MAGLSRYVDFMEANFQAWWDLLHWIMIDVEQDGESKDLYAKRRVRTDSLIRKYNTEVKRLRCIPKFSESLFQEPGRPKLLIKQLEGLDEREPARTMWTTAANEVEHTKHVPDELRKKSIPLPKRARNWIVPNREDKSTEGDEDEDADDEEESEEDDEEEEEGEEEESDEEMAA
ncbi:uncharacterized protein IUM83_11840 [Phytophthora cinnamomi]|uniref:uncharacterized protein n=1 Tax=Phytophthora cinnamomi TaxID=4785 RepID=UPI0035596E27|nr:hypothetical protein IUM83_11840 [Phytophthora cinnamomi]